MQRPSMMNRPPSAKMYSTEYESKFWSTYGLPSALSGQEITFEQMLNSDHEFAPEVETLTPDSPAPLKKGEDGKYPVPNPTAGRTREY